jgi:hypothetical protein
LPELDGIKTAYSGNVQGFIFSWDHRLHWSEVLEMTGRLKPTHGHHKFQNLPT